MAPAADGSLSLGAFGAFFASLAWAVGSAAYTSLAARSSAPRVNFSRALFSMPCFLVMAALQWPGVRNAIEQTGAALWSRAGWLAVGMFASYVVADSLFIYCARLLGIANAQAIGSIYPLWSAAAGILVLGESLSALRTFGLFAAVGGTAFLILQGHRHAKKQRLSSSDIALARSSSRDFRNGVLLALLVSLLWALNTFAVRMGSVDLPLPLVGVMRMMFALAFCPVVGFVTSRHVGNPAIPLRDLVRNAPIFVFESFGGGLAYVYAMANAPLAVAAALSSLAPVLMLPVVVYMKLERITVSKAIGVCVVTAGVVCLVL